MKEVECGIFYDLVWVCFGGDIILFYIMGKEREVEIIFWLL